jgi:hypothetical protein
VLSKEMATVLRAGFFHGFLVGLFIAVSGLVVGFAYVNGDVFLLCKTFHLSNRFLFEIVDTSQMEAE